MIRARFFFKSGEITGFAVKGHADYGSYGHDIVCAAVSSAVQMTVNTITGIGISASGGTGNGCVVFRLNGGNADTKTARVVLKGLRRHLKLLTQEYGRYIKVQDLEV